MTEETLKYGNKVRVESMDDIVFANRHKEYGAYELRRKYKKNIIIAFFIAFLILCGAIAKPLIEAYRLRGKQRQERLKVVSIVSENMNKEDLPPPPPPPPPPPAVEAQVKYVAPKVVDTVKVEVEIATVDEVKEQVVEAPPTEIVVEEKIDEDAGEGMFIVEENATFQGGDVNNFRNWVQEHISYPAAASEAGISGKVIIQFSVNSKGQIIDVRVLRGVHPELDREAMEGIKKSPPWTPGKQGGKSVKQNFIIPITFQLQ